MCRTHAAAEMGGAVNVQGRELLPTNVVPRHYNVTLEPDFKKLTFDGTVVIDLDVASNSNSISLHTLELDIHNANITSAGQTIRLVVLDDFSLPPPFPLFIVSCPPGFPFTLPPFFLFFSLSHHYCLLPIP